MVSPTDELTGCLSNYFRLGTEDEKREKVEKLSAEIVEFLAQNFKSDEQSFNFKVRFNEFSTGVLSERVIVGAVKAAINDLHPDFEVTTNGIFKLDQKDMARKCEFSVHRINHS